MPGINDQILNTTQSTIENAPKLITGDITPQSLLNRYQFTLQQFGLSKVNALILQPGGKIANPKEETGFTTKAITGIDYNMNTGNGTKQMLSPLGTPVFCDLILEGSKTLGFKTQLFWVLCDVTSTKNIVKTTVAGANGTDKEFMGVGDFIIDIKGVISKTFGHEYPKEEVQKLITLANLPENIIVTSEFLRMFGIYEIVIEEGHFGQVAGRQNSQTFELKCVSDIPKLLRKKKKV